MSAQSLPTIHVHHSPRESLIPLLQSHLPFSGPLLRRIQHEIICPSETAKCLATYVPRTLLPEQQHSASVSSGSPWLAAYVDVHSGRDTQAWVYSSLEPLSAWKTNGDESVSTFYGGNAISPGALAEAHAQLIMLLSYIRTELLPEYLATLKDEEAVNTDNGYATIPTPVTNTNEEDVKALKKLPAHPPTSVLVGTLHSGLLEILMSVPQQSLTTGLPQVHIHRTNHPNVKYIFPRNRYAALHSGEDNIGLPGGYRFHNSRGQHGIQRHQLDLVNSRTNIYRSEKLLLSLASAALYNDDDDDESTMSGRLDNSEETPMGWAFLGYDGSLMTLHVEPEHRGKGLAAQLGKEVMRIGMASNSTLFDLGADAAEEKGWVFADVFTDNIASRRVMEKMGGEAKWTDGWVVAEVCEEGECHYCSLKAGGT